MDGDRDGGSVQCARRAKQTHVIARFAEQMKDWLNLLIKLHTTYPPVQGADIRTSDTRLAGVVMLW